MRSILLQAPDSHLDAATIAIIRKWDVPETAAQVLEALDCAVYGGGASDFMMKVLNILLQSAIEDEKTTYEDVCKVAKATWRTLPPYAELAVLINSPDVKNVLTHLRKL